MRLTRLTTPLTILIFVAVLTVPALASSLPDPALPDNPEAVATENSQDQVPAAAPVPVGAELKYSRFHKVLGRNLTTNLFSKKNLLPFVIGSAASLAISPADQEISDALRGKAPEVGTVGKYMGGVGMLTIVGGSFFVSLSSQNEHFREFGYTLAEAYVENFILTHALKYATNRARPDKSDSLSFPSGHASDSFTVSTVMWKYYGWKWGVPMYAVSTFVGISRIEHGKHWASDTIAGAALGYISANAAFIGSKRELAGKKIAGLTVAPLYGHDQRGISVVLRY